jgi:hypothetical protein
MWWQIATAVIGGILVAAIVNWNTIQSWIQSHRTPSSAYAGLIKQRLASGKYRVVGGIFNQGGQLETSGSWETDSIDDELQRRFGFSDEARIQL